MTKADHKALKEAANYIPGHGWYLDGVHPDSPDCTSSHFLGRNKEDAHDELCARDEAETNNGIDIED